MSKASQPRPKYIKLHMKFVFRFLISALIVFCVSGCTEFSFGRRNWFPSKEHSKYFVYARYTPKEQPGLGKDGKADFDVDVWESKPKGNHLIAYHRSIIVTDADFDVKMEHHQLSVSAVDHYVPSRKWLVLFSEDQAGQFHLIKEEGPFRK